MPKYVEVNATKEFANTFLNDIFFRMAVNRVLDAAPAADVEKVLRCKDCKFWSDGIAGCTDHVKCCKVAYYMVHENGYCSFAERKEDG